MSDLKERLRNTTLYDGEWESGLPLEAAARIEELEAENARLNALCDQMKIGWGEDAVCEEAARRILTLIKKEKDQ